MAQGPFAPPVGESGTLAMHKDSSAFAGWASSCSISRGLQDITNPDLGEANVGTEVSATGKSGLNGVVSLGDGGEAVLTFNHPIFDGQGPDFAVFENSFDGLFLELGHVEVSSDGINFVRFKSVSLTQQITEVGSFEELDATNIYNLAGKYRAQYGTPFDLSELANEPGLDVNNITHVKIIDVVGSLDGQYASYDSLGNAINDPFPTAFGSGGFDLDAVGVIHEFVGIEEANNDVKVYPNPCKGNVYIESDHANFEISLMTLQGELIRKTATQGNLTVIDISELNTGIYLLQITQENSTSSQKIIVE